LLWFISLFNFYKTNIGFWNTLRKAKKSKNHMNKIIL